MIRIDCTDCNADTTETSAKIRAACDAMTREGYVVLDHLLDDDSVQALRVEFTEVYADYCNDRNGDDTLIVGDRRFMLPVALSGAFANWSVYAHAFVVAMVREMLGIDAILESFGAVLSLSGAEKQHVHRDGSVLFDMAISTLLPAHALSFALPLIDMNQEHGTTAIWPGSHRWQRHDPQRSPELPEVSAGSGILWDFRTYHAGTPNVSGRHRPMIYATYAKRWYKDPNNFEKAEQQRLVFPPDFLQRVPENCRALFGHLPQRPWEA